MLIARKADQLEVELKTARPGVLVGRQGSGIEELRSGIQKTIGDSGRQVRINVVEVERVTVMPSSLPSTSPSSWRSVWPSAAPSAWLCSALSVPAFWV